MDSTSSPPTAGSLTKPCKKCRTQEATLDSRGQPVCSDCFTKFITTKCVKQIGLLGRETVPKTTPNPAGHGPPVIPTRQYVLGLSLGACSTSLLNLLHQNVEYQLSKNRGTPFDLTVVHITSSQEDAPPDPLAQHRLRYPRFKFLTVPLSSALALPTIDWSSLALTSPPSSLAALFGSLPSSSVASRTDILSLLTSHLLLHHTHSSSSQALLLGHSTTAIAELTLSQTAKGRGFSLPWQINDGIFTLVDYSSSSSSPSSSSPNEPPTKYEILVYYPLRDVLRKELVTYSAVTASPPLTDLILTKQEKRSGNGNGTAKAPAVSAVVNHKDLSIEEVMFRYFADVEENYPSIVANVARTTGKLVRLLGTEADGGRNSSSSSSSRCGLCSMPMDGEGDQRWRGELGTATEHDKIGKATRLCYGCERSTLG